VRREKALDFSGCNSTPVLSTPDSCSAGPAMKCFSPINVQFKVRRVWA
jgi:hypothetical protein